MTWKNERKKNYISYSYPFLTTIIIMTNNINIASNGSGRSADSAVSATINFTFYPFPPDLNDAAPRSTIPTLSIAVHDLIKSQARDTKISIKLPENVHGQLIFTLKKLLFKLFDLTTIISA